MTPKLPTALRGLACALALGLVMLIGAPAASAAPKLDISQTTGLKDGSSITVSGSGFAPNLKSIAVGQCKEGYKGPADCNTATGATFVNADANGSFKAVTLKMKEKYGSVDCTKQQCVIGAAPLPNANSADVVSANTANVNLEFGAAAAEQPADQPAAAPATTAPATTAPATTTQSDTSNALPKTGGTDTLPVLLLGAAALLLPGLGLLLGLPGRRRREVGA
ncbi:neocarzinostatin apoprotein domain-containing protein [Mumia sp. DW29H23]|uniref:neocarzinostatin apoprotein domain-containing protein n=1 Tax=Mumia sp. DW29H23 TaxID=3421241 RepID=UPI003D69FD8B